MASVFATAFAVVWYCTDIYVFRGVHHIPALYYAIQMLIRVWCQCIGWLIWVILPFFHSVLFCGNKEVVLQSKVACLGCDLESYDSAFVIFFDNIIKSDVVLCGSKEQRVHSRSGYRNRCHSPQIYFLTFSKEGIFPFK